jgi:hypothetical protein
MRRPANFRTTIARPPPRGSARCSHDLYSHRDDSPPMEVDGIEPTTPCLQSRCSPTELHPPGDTIRWPEPHPIRWTNLVGQGGFEPPTPRLSSVCSNQLSYWPHEAPHIETPRIPRVNAATPLPNMRDMHQPTRLVAGKGYVDGAQPGQASIRPATGIRRQLYRNHPKHRALLPEGFDDIRTVP